MDRPTLRMYVDENGNYNLREDLSNDSNRYLCLTGVVMRIEAHDLLTQQLDDLKTKYFGSKDVILHRREIISAKPPFEALKDNDTRLNYNADILRIISELRYGVISIVIDKKALVDKYTLLRAQDPYALALEYLMQRYQYWMQDYSQRHGAIIGDIVAESRGGREDRITKDTYRLIYDGKGYNRLNDASQYYSSKEIKLRKKKANIAGLQFVDLISHPARRYILSQNHLAHNLKPTSFEQTVVEILVKEKFRRHNGKIDGYGAVFFPK
ncbi:MAG TPA: DUF3800 domain-containing protein [Candidatus Fimivivens faecavium]|nr:DUF3800 domain-containing protein [Candidatus Fimivivens faecavium]